MCGGIVGNLVSPGNSGIDGSKVASCYNLGNVEAMSTTEPLLGGIDGYDTYSNIINSYTTGSVTAGKNYMVGAVVGRIRYGPLYATNVYFLETVHSLSVGFGAQNLTGEITSKSDIYMKSQDFVNDLNNSMSEEASNLGISWKYNPGGYPTF